MQEIFLKYLSNSRFLTLKFSTEEFDVAADDYYKLYNIFMPSNKEAKILDIGCGQGHFLYLLKKMGYKDFQGIDVSPEQVEFCREHVSDRVEVANALDFLGSNTNYDFIIMNDVLEHIPKEDIIFLLREVYESLRTEGVFICKVPNMGNPFNLYARYTDFTHEVGFTAHSLEQVMRISGFKNVKVYPYGSLSCGVRRKLKFLGVKVILLGLSKFFEISYKPWRNEPFIPWSRLIFSVAKKKEI